MDLWSLSKTKSPSPSSPTSFNQSPHFFSIGGLLRKNTFRISIRVSHALPHVIKSDTRTEWGAAVGGTTLNWANIPWYSKEDKVTRYIHYVTRSILNLECCLLYCCWLSKKEKNGEMYSNGPSSYSCYKAVRVSSTGTGPEETVSQMCRWQSLFAFIDYLFHVTVDRLFLHFGALYAQVKDLRSGHSSKSRKQNERTMNLSTWIEKGPVVKCCTWRCQKRIKCIGRDGAQNNNTRI